MATIVIVDNDGLVREVVAEALKNAAHTVVSVEDGAKAVSRLQDCEPDLVILDCALPENCGLPILQELRASPKFQALPILILTDRRSDGHARLALDTGASAYLRKPFKVADLLKNVSALLQNALPSRHGADRDCDETDLLIDTAYIQTLQNSLGSQDTQALLVMMASTLDQSIQALVRSLESHDHQSVAEKAHALAGAAKTIGAPRLVGLCRLIEKDPKDRRDLSAQLFATGKATREAIENLLPVAPGVLPGEIGRQGQL